MRPLALRQSIIYDYIEMQLWHTILALFTLTQAQKLTCICESKKSDSPELFIQVEELGFAPLQQLWLPPFPHCISIILS